MHSIATKLESVASQGLEIAREVLDTENSF